MLHCQQLPTAASPCLAPTSGHCSWCSRYVHTAVAWGQTAMKDVVAVPYITRKALQSNVTVLACRRYIHTAVARGHAVMKDVVAVPYTTTYQLAVLYRASAKFRKQNNRRGLGRSRLSIISFVLCIRWRCVAQVRLSPTASGLPPVLCQRVRNLLTCLALDQSQHLLLVPVLHLGVDRPKSLNNPVSRAPIP